MESESNNRDVATDLACAAVNIIIRLRNGGNLDRAEDVILAVPS